MSTTSSSWVGNVLTKFHLRYNMTDDFRIDRYWLMMDRSSLVERVYETCHAINSCAREGIIYGEMFTRPHAIAIRVGFIRGDIEYLMSLAMLEGRPTLLFSSRKEHLWNKSVLRRFRHSLKRKENIICKHVINPSKVSDADIQQWFTYLLSGLRRSFKPAEATAPQGVFELNRIYSPEGSILL